MWIYDWLVTLERKIEQLIKQQATIIGLLTKQGALSMSMKDDIDALIAEVEQNKTVQGSAIAMIEGMSEMLSNLQGQVTDPQAQAAIQQAVAALDAQSKELAAAIEKNTQPVATPQRR